MDELENYKELYYKEIEYTERLNSKINTCITFLTITGSGLILVWSQLEKVGSGIQFWLYLILCAISSVLFIVCIYFFYKAYSGYNIHYYPIKEMAIVCNQTYELAEKGQIKKKQAEKHIKDMMSERYLNDAIHNREQNRLKNERHRRLINFIAITFMVILINYASSVYILNYVNVEQNVYKCECCKGGGKMENGNDEIKLTQPTINGVPLPQTPKAEAINESFNLIDDSNANVLPKQNDE